MPHTDTLCMACDSPACNFRPLAMQRRPVGDHDLLIDMLYCGVCHSDLHKAANHNSGLGSTQYPCVPGHELAGVCIQVGSKVTKFQIGQQVGVGCLVDSCQQCDACRGGNEQLCSKSVSTYGATDNGSGRAETFPAGRETLGGYTTRMVVDENFGVLIPAEYPLECAGPVMCAGITMYDPLKKAAVGKGSRVGIVGLGGLGQMGIKLAKAMGCDVSVVSRSADKRGYAESCGADTFVVSSEQGQMDAAEGSMDLILNTIPAYHDYCQYNSLLSDTGKQILLGLHKGIGAAMIADRCCCRSKVGMSAIGGVANTQEVINLCAEFDIKPDIKIVPVTELNNVYTTLDEGNKDNLRYVLDIKGSLTKDACENWEEVAPPRLGEFSGGISVCSVLCECCWLFWCCKIC
eukprot:TRINITY_DN55326_c0_g1_i1.p1 TRINITY_DN55326_c0_g1~~TRINITY_DN55326_c0_g1_i1.p1  ORF type:complete len:404 (+),score=84.53 TRINITY_DN55326_c0_g1_i1:200-1411(+)